MGKTKVIVLISILSSAMVRAQDASTGSAASLTSSTPSVTHFDKHSGVDSESSEEKYYVRPGLITATATISPSIMLNRNQINYYVTGFWQIRFHKNLTFRGEGHYLTGGNKDIPYFRNNFRGHFGVEYHKSVRNFDSYIGFMPGFSLLQLTDDRSLADEQMMRFVPTFSANIGMTYYVWKYFNFFLNVTYMNTTIRGVTQTYNRADEIMFSGGIGFNINAKK